MPKSEKLIEIFKIAKTYNKFRIMRLLSDKIPRDMPQIVYELSKTEKILRNTVYVALESLIKDNIITRNSTYEYFLSKSTKNEEEESK